MNKEYIFAVIMSHTSAFLLGMCVLDMIKLGNVEYLTPIITAFLLSIYISTAYKIAKNSKK